MDNVTFSEALQIVARENGIDDETYAPTITTSFDAKAATELLHTHTEAQELLYKRGISLSVAISAGVGVYRHPNLGDCVAFPYTATDVKLRAINPTQKGGKFLHIAGGKTSDRLFLASALDDPFNELSSERDVYVCESELDCLLLRSHGFNAASVSSATTCLKQGQLSIIADDWNELEKADRVFVLCDMDNPGQKCADAFTKLLPRYKCFRINWPYLKGEAGAVKDVGELYQSDPVNFKAQLFKLREAAIARPPQWRTKFKAVHEMDNSSMEYLVEGFLPEGISFLGALAGSGKTWLALSLAKALTSGDRFLDRFTIPKRRYVLYLVPEAGERSFRARLDKMRLKNDHFICRTMSDGEMWLDDADLLDAVRQLKPVVILDTLARFNKADSENDASQTSKGTCLCGQWFMARSDNQECCSTQCRQKKWARTGKGKEAGKLASKAFYDRERLQALKDAFKNWKALPARERQRNDWLTWISKAAKVRKAFVAAALESGELSR